MRLIRPVVRSENYTIALFPCLPCANGSVGTACTKGLCATSIVNISQSISVTIVLALTLFCASGPRYVEKGVVCE